MAACLHHTDRWDGRESTRGSAVRPGGFDRTEILSIQERATRAQYLLPGSPRAKRWCLQRWCETDGLAEYRGDRRPCGIFSGAEIHPGVRSARAADECPARRSHSEQTG